MQEYKVRLKSGRELGPFGADAIQKLIEKGHVDGTEMVRVYPSKDWIPFLKVAELKSLLPEEEGEKTKIFDASSAGRISSDVGLSDGPVGDFTEDDETGIYSEPTQVVEIKPEIDPGPQPLPDVVEDPSLHREKTVMLDRSAMMGGLVKSDEIAEDASAPKRKIPKKSVLVMILMAILAYELAFEDEEKTDVQPKVEMVPVRPRLPAGSSDAVDPELSQKYFDAGVRFYLEDTVQGYRKAEVQFHRAITAAPDNVKALALLASTYLNLIDASNKDETTFSVINKLIEMSRSGKVQLTETMIAELEFLAVLNRTDAAIQKVTEYYRAAGKMDASLYMFLSVLFYQKGDLKEMGRALNSIPASALPIARLYYLRGLLAEKTGDANGAYNEYVRAIKINKAHARSMLGIVRLMQAKGDLAKAKTFLNFLVSNPSLMTPSEYVEALSATAEFALLQKRPDLAAKFLGDAIQIDPRNENLRLNYYTLLAQVSKDPESKFAKMAKMYALVMEAEGNLKNGQEHEAMTTLISARDEFPKSAIPVERMGDLFFRQGDYAKAERSFMKALELDSESSRIAVKAIETKIRLFDFDGAKKIISKFQSNPNAVSALDRLNGDLAFRQGAYVQAIQSYRKAMSRESIDNDVYVNYAETLREINECSNAQFFYSLADRLDPLGVRAKEGSALCLLKTDGIQSAVSVIQSALATRTKASEELLLAMANVYFAAGDSQRASGFVDQILEQNPNFARAYLLQAKVFEQWIGTDKKAIKKSMDALDQYIEMNPNDTDGHLRAYEVALKIPDFDRAMDALDKVFQLVPLYPDLHTRRAVVLNRMGRTKEALDEFNAELKNNPKNVKVLIQVGNLYVDMGRVDEAILKFVDAMKLDPTSADAKSGAGYANYLKRNYPSAIALLKNAVALDKGNPVHYKRLGMALRDGGDREGARQAFQNYLNLYPDAPDRDQFQ